MNVIISKVLSLLGIFTFSILFGIAPIFLEKCIRSPKVKWVNDIVICFSGGTLLGISFLHLIPETRESVFRLQEKGHFQSVPHQLSLADTVIVAGFFFIYILDEVIHLILERLGAEHAHQPHGHVKRSNPPDTEDNSRMENIGKRQSDDTESIQSAGAIHIPGILTIVAISFHDIFEGLALGIQDHVEDVLFLFLSVATHKYAISFSVSLDLLLSGMRHNMILLYTLIFSIVNPLGVGIGIAYDLLRREGDLESPFTVLMEGVASGSLIYVVCFEVLQRHGSSGESHVVGIRNTVFVIIGFVFILIMKILMPHDHHLREGHHLENSLPNHY